MKKLGISLIVAFALSLAAAVAQTGTDSSQANPGASPSATQPSTPSHADPAAGQAGSMTATGAGASEKAETLQGCVQAQGGQYVLEDKSGKQVALTGQDVSSQVGHEVSLKGTWASGAGTGVSTASGASSDKSFNVTTVDTLSSTCTGKSSGSTGASPSGSNPAGTGSTNPPQK